MRVAVIARQSSDTLGDTVYAVSQNPSHLCLPIILKYTIRLQYFFGRSVTEKVRNQLMFYFPTSPI